jgi:hypothetical protein
LFSLSSNLTSEERPERPINEQALVAAAARLVFLTVHEDADFVRAALDAAGSAMSLRRGSLPT